MSGNANLYLVIMAGGSGTRFWPKSTSKRPKQLLAFGKNRETLLQQTLRRFDGMVPAALSNRMIVTTELLREQVSAQCPPSTVEVLAEPAGRNTAPCVYWAARKIIERDPNGVMLVMPSDHYIHDVAGFDRAIRAAITHATTHDDLVTLGVIPTRAETGYGYLKKGQALTSDCARVDAFVEKPSRARAEEFLSSGDYFWNGGMFVWKASAILAGFTRFMPELDRAWAEAKGDVIRAYPQMTATSIDFGVMEKAENVVTIPLDCGWDDVGSWTSLEMLAETLGARSPCGTVTAGQVVHIDATGNVVDAPDQLVALLGVNNLIVVRQGDTILVADKTRAQDLRLIVEAVKRDFPDRA